MCCLHWAAQCSFAALPDYFDWHFFSSSPFNCFKNNIRRCRTERCVDTASVKPPGTTLAKNLFPVDVTGLELAGSMAELTRHVFRRDFRRVDPAELRPQGRGAVADD